ncbi:MAG: flavin reductase family protein [Clostridia bacterium]|nr:flavin reductase family protein [Clostridia bacterium]
MAKQTWKGGAMLSPVPPALVTCSDGEHDNVLTIAWTGIVNTIPPKTYISVRPSRHSYEIIKKSGVFAINLTTEQLVRAADFCGVHTGAKIDKFERCCLSKEPAREIDCPILSDSPLSLECRVTDVIPLGSHDMFLADIVAVDVDESLIGQDGKLRLDRADLVAYAHGDYYALGKKLGNFGFSVAKKKKNRPNQNHKTAPRAPKKGS